MASAYQAIEGWFDFEDVYELALRRCGRKPARFVEVGVFKGRSTCYMIERILECDLDVDFHVVDIFTGDADVGHGDFWPQFAANLDHAGVLAHMTPHRRASPDVASAFEDQSLDFVFIDACHKNGAVSRDLAGWWPKLRPGALMAGHDYHTNRGVRAAVDEFVAARDLYNAFRLTRSSWLIYRSLTIDAAYCINLARRPDRRRRAAVEFGVAGLAADVTFFEATDGTRVPHPAVVSDGQAGCCMSHLNVQRTAREKGHSHILIFEDDIELANNFRGRFASALARCPASYDLCYVGALCNGAWGNYLHPFDDLLSRAGSVCGTHAYIVNLERWRTIEAGLGDLRCVIDEWYARELQPSGDCYAFTPWLASQAYGWSDVAGTVNANGSHAGYVWR